MQPENNNQNPPPASGHPNPVNSVPDSSPSGEVVSPKTPVQPSGVFADVITSSPMAPPANLEPAVNQQHSDNNMYSNLPETKAGDMIQPQLNVNSNSQQTIVSAPKVKHHRKKLLLLTLFILLVGGAAAAYEGYYLPNQPQNIWKTALLRTGKGYDNLVSYANTQKTSNYKGYDFSGTFKGLFGSSTLTGTLTSSTDGNNSIGTLYVASGTSSVKMNLLSVKQINSANPNIYFQVTGVKSIATILGVGDFGTKVDGLDGKWILVDHTYLENLENQIKSNFQTNSSNTTLSRTDVLNSIEALGQVSKQYLLSTDPSKEVLVVSKNVGKEKVGSRNEYHYKVKFNKSNLLSYLNALHSTLPSTKLGQWLATETGESTDQLINYSNLKTSINSISSSYTADVWVDMQTKLLRTIRFSDTSNPTNNYLDFGLNYEGGTKYPLEISSHTSQSGTTTALSLITTFDSSNSSVELNLGYSSSSGSTISDSANVDLKMTPSNSAVNVSVPTQTISLSQALDDLGLNGTVNNLLGTSGN